MMIGLVLYAGQGGFAGQVVEIHRAVRPDPSGLPPEVFSSLPAVFHGLTGAPRDPLAVIALGLVVLLATPVLGVVVAVCGFLGQGDRPYAAIAGLVLSLLLGSLFLAGGVG
jgi:uncharacterized membrane protein